MNEGVKQQMGLCIVNIYASARTCICIIYLCEWGINTINYLGKTLVTAFVGLQMSIQHRACVARFWARRRVCGLNIVLYVRVHEHTYIHTHTHTHIYIYIHITLLVFGLQDARAA